MKIGVISDTHIPISAASLPQGVYKYFKDCDLIIHAGDCVDAGVLDELNRIAETKAVSGNMDSPEVKSAYPRKLILRAGSRKIGVTHGSGSAKNVLQRVKQVFKDDDLDIIIFGHSHNPVKKTLGGTLYFNPGSATDTLFSPYRSLGIIEIKGDSVSASIVRLD